MDLRQTLFNILGASGRTSHRAPSRQLLVATRNSGKAREFKQLFSGALYNLMSLEEVGIVGDVQETADSFEENAMLKARGYCAISGMLTVSDDSGLEVDALGGAPGVKSARYGGPGLSDEDRVDLLLKNLRHVPWDYRTARFRCVIAIASPEGDVGLASGSVEGLIGYQPKGSNGFGYDPVFFLPELGLTTAQLPPEQKNSMSHRGVAAKKAVELLRAL